MCLDQIQDLFVDIARLKKVGKDTPAILEKVILMVEEYHRLLYNKKPEHMIAFRDSTKKILVLYEKPVIERDLSRLLFIAEAFNQLSHKTV